MRFWSKMAEGKIKQTTVTRYQLRRWALVNDAGEQKGCCEVRER